MILPLTSASTVLFGAALVAGASVVTAGEYGGGGRITEAADRCAVYGSGFTDVGHGTCVRTHVRVDGTRNAAADAWTTGGTSSAALRFDGLGMLPSAASSHLRVRSGLDSYSPFR